MGEVVPFKRRGSMWLAGAMLLAALGGAGLATLDMSKVADAAVELRMLPDAGRKPSKITPARMPQQGMAGCIVDGDTFWWKGEKIRIENIDAPEMTRMCSGKPVNAEKAAERFAQLSDGDVTLIRYGKDKYGRTLARVVIDCYNIGDRMVSEGFARTRPDGGKTWCDA